MWNQEGNGSKQQIPGLQKAKNPAGKQGFNLSEKTGQLFTWPDRQP